MTGSLRQSFSHHPRRVLLLGLTAACAAVSYFLAFQLYSDFQLPAPQLASFFETLPLLLAVRTVLAYHYKVDEDFWQHVSMRDLLRLMLVATLGSIAFPVVLLLIGKPGVVPVTVLILDWILIVALTGGARVIARLRRERDYVGSGATRRGRRTFIIGAGEAGEQILRQLQHDRVRRFEVVGMIDDDTSKVGRVLHGVPVLGTSAQLRGLVSLHDVSHAIIAIVSASPPELSRLVDRCVDAGVELQMLPPLKDQMTSEVNLSQVRDVQIEDLLGREPVSFDAESIRPHIAGKVVVVTGAGGSIGSELARQIVRLNPRELILVERAESPLHYIHLEVSQGNPNVSVVPVLASVTNAERLQSVFDARRPDVVFHAAAYKHVPMLEWNVVEGVWNNVIGTLRAARCAARSGCSRFILISTDKAVRPTSVLGATKLIAERIVLDLPSLRSSGTDFRVVRFGNVLGSDGSVIPTFKRQLSEGGPLTITHPDMKRYFMTIPEAVQLVLRAVTLPETAGRIALLEMGHQVSIVEMAENLIRLAGFVPHKDVEIVFTGLRPGEKLEEELLGPGEAAFPTSVPKIRVVQRSEVAGSATVLARQLRRLTQVAAELDEADIRRALVAVAPEYTTEIPFGATARARSRRPAARAPRKPQDTNVYVLPTANGNGVAAHHNGRSGGGRVESGRAIAGRSGRTIANYSIGNGHHGENGNGAIRDMGNGNGRSNGNGNGHGHGNGNGNSNGHGNGNGHGHGNSNGNGNGNGNGIGNGRENGIAARSNGNSVNGDEISRDEIERLRAATGARPA